ncbi:hypothetical protein PR048_008454 [Dryococelus australis]|uniref:Uncharacterized protein n=1 Tax=Dryococelus australis TaxID=614101 RepID=A0ABQ9HX55_9NEOP|nr:hypothetical protein PR048_008454 [Dryococelus australis]
MSGLAPSSRVCDIQRIRPPRISASLDSRRRATVHATKLAWLCKLCLYGVLHDLTRTRQRSKNDITNDRGASVAERLARSPPTSANCVKSPAGSPDFRMWESCRTMPLVGGFSRGSPVSPALSFRRCSKLTYHPHRLSRPRSFSFSGPVTCVAVAMAAYIRMRSKHGFGGSQRLSSEDILFAVDWAFEINHYKISLSITEFILTGALTGRLPVRLAAISENDWPQSMGPTKESVEALRRIQQECRERAKSEEIWAALNSEVLRADEARFALVGSKQSNRSATTAPCRKRSGSGRTGEERHNSPPPSLRGVKIFKLGTIMRVLQKVLTWCSVQNTRIPFERAGFDSLPGHFRIFASGTERCRWSAGILGDLPFPPALAFRRCSILTSSNIIGSQDLDSKFLKFASHCRTFVQHADWQLKSRNVLNLMPLDVWFCLCAMIHKHQSAPVVYFLPDASWTVPSRQASTNVKSHPPLRAVVVERCRCQERRLVMYPSNRNFEISLRATGNLTLVSYGPVHGHGATVAASDANFSAVIATSVLPLTDTRGNSQDVYLDPYDNSSMVILYKKNGTHPCMGCDVVSSYNDRLSNNRLQNEEETQFQRIRSGLNFVQGLGFLGAINRVKEYSVSSWIRVKAPPPGTNAVAYKVSMTEVAVCQLSKVQQIIRQLNARSRRLVIRHTIQNYFLAMAYRIRRPTMACLLTTHPNAQLLPHFTCDLPLASKDPRWCSAQTISPPNKANRVRFLAGSLPNFRMWGSCWTMPLVVGFSPVISRSPRPYIPALVHTHLTSPLSDVKTSMLRATQISPLFTPHVSSGGGNTLVWGLFTVEHIVNTLEKDVCTPMGSFPTDLCVLGDAVLRSWTSMSPGRFRCLEESTPRCITTEIRAE